MVVDGKDQPAVMTIPRNGVFYTLDARTGTAILPPRGIDGKAVTALKQIDLNAVPSAAPGTAAGTRSGGAPDESGALTWGEASRINAANAPTTSMGHAWFPMG